MKKLQKYFVPLYIIILILSFFYIRSILKEDTIDVSKVQEVPPTEKIVFYDINLNVQNLSNTRTYKVKLKNNDTVIDLLETLRDKQDFIFEKTEYVDHLELYYVNGVNAPEGYLWRVYENDVDVTNNISDTVLQENAEYLLKLEAL